MKTGTGRRFAAVVGCLALVLVAVWSSLVHAQQPALPAGGAVGETVGSPRVGDSRAGGPASPRAEGATTNVNSGTADQASLSDGLGPFAVVRGNTPPGLADARLVGHPQGSEPISIVITLDLRDHAGVDALLAAQQDPASPLYHQWISPEEFQARFGPLPADLEAAADFLASQGFVNISQPTSTMVAADGSVDLAEQAFGVVINEFTYHERFVYSNDRDPSLPAALAGKVAYVGGLDNLTVMYPSHFPPTPYVPPPPPLPGEKYLYLGNNYYLPRDNQVAYGEKAGYFDTGKKGISGAELAIASSFDIQLSDVNDQLTREGDAAAGYNLLTAASSGPHTVSSTCVPNTGSGVGCFFAGYVSPDGGDSLETIWDTSMAASIANDNHIGVYLTSDQLTTSFSVLYQYLADRAGTIKVVAHSWGLCLSLMSSGVVTADDNALAQAAAAGQAWFVATGDGGSNDCPSGSGGANPDVNYPAASPYVTGCGGTTQDPTGAFGGDGWLAGYPPNGEAACSNGGGGEATAGVTEPRPSWQTGTGVPAGTKRLVPDVSLHYGTCTTPNTGKPYLAMISGSLFTINGTSACGPQWAGYWAVANQVVGTNLGQAAPLMFRVLRSEAGTSYANSFHDITTGSNGFPATTGYDRATGVGTPKWNGLYPALQTLFTPGTLQGTVTDSATSSPLNGATVTATGSPGSFTTSTNPSGFYQFASIVPGTYTVTAAAAGYNTGSVTGVVVSSSLTTTQNFSLTLGPTSGCLTDTTQANFQAGTPNSVDTNVSAGDVKLASTGGQVADQRNLILSLSGYGFSNTTWGAQTFTPTVSGTLTRLDLNLFCSGCSGTNPDITVSIRATASNLPTGADLATATIPGFSSGAGGWYSATFATPASLTAGTVYAYVFRLTAARTGTQAYSTSTASVYAGGRRCTSSNSGSSWTGQTQDLGFVAYMTTPTVYSTSGDLTSALKDANPLPVSTASWTSLAWTATTPANTTVKFQAAGSTAAGGPFTFVGPDGTAATFFTTSPANLTTVTGTPFNGKRYLKYKAFLSTTVTSTTPTLSDVTACYTIACNPPATPTSPLASPSNISYGGSSSLSATVGGGETVDWYTGSCPGGTFVGSGNPLSVSPTATTTYYAQARNTTTGCTSVSCAAGVTVTVDAAVVISQVYGGGGNSGATWKNDFIELFNRSTVSVNLNGWSVQYAASGGTSWSVTNLTNFTLAPGQYYLVQEAAGSGGTQDLPTPDATGSIAMSATAGKVALRSTNATITSGTSCPIGDGVTVDFVGYGTAANCSEGSSPTATLSNTTAALRNNNGCTDTNNNGADFTVGAPNPRNTSSPLTCCSTPDVPTSPAATPATICSGASSTLSATVGSGGDTLEWFSDSCGGTPLGGQSPSVSPTTTTIYYVRSNNGSTGCVSGCVSVTVNVDTAGPTFTDIPSNVTVYADAGLATASDVEIGQATATDAHNGVASLVATRSDSLPLSSPYPQGTTTITWTATDGCGNVTADSTQTVFVRDKNALVVDVGLRGISSGTISRCIRLELKRYDCSSFAIDQSMSFANGVATGQFFEVPWGSYQCILAQDDLHTLTRRLDRDAGLNVANKQYVASFTGSGADLINGDLYDDNLIDIVDFGVYIAGWGLNPGGVTCATEPPHADINGDNAVDITDFNFISGNFLAIGDSACCEALRGGAPRTTITVAELNRLGLAYAARGDLNHDGVVDLADVELFLSGVVPPVPKQIEPDDVSPVQNPSGRTE